MPNMINAGALVSMSNCPTIPIIDGNTATGTITLQLLLNRVHPFWMRTIGPSSVFMAVLSHKTQKPANAGLLLKILYR